MNVLFPKKHSFNDSPILKGALFPYFCFSSREKYLTIHLSTNFIDFSVKMGLFGRPKSPGATRRCKPTPTGRSRPTGCGNWLRHRGLKTKTPKGFEKIRFWKSIDLMLGES